MIIKKFFNSIDHAVIYKTVQRLIKDQETLGLFRNIIDASGDQGVGLPIGNLTSQWLANLLLDRLDHFVKEALRIPGYVRYEVGSTLQKAQKLARHSDPRLTTNIYTKHDLSELANEVNKLGAKIKKRQA